MQIHIALYRWKPGADQKHIDEALDAVKALHDKVEGIYDISIGNNSSQYGQGYTHVILVRAEDEAAITAYREHADHQAAAKLIEALEEDGIGVDFSNTITVRDRFISE